MRRTSISLFVAPIVVLVSVTLALSVQLPSDPDLVYVRATGIDRERNRPIAGLSKANLMLFEDNKPQDIVYFSEESLPLQLQVIWDMNNGTKDDVKGRTISAMSKSGAANAEILVMEPGKASFSDVVIQALNTLAQNGNDKKRVLVLFTSRTSPGSYPLSKVRDRLKELDIQLYVVSQQTSSEISSDSDRQALTDLAELSGGKAFFPSVTYELTDVARNVVTQLRHQYILGYRSTNRATDGKWRKIKVTGEFRDEKTNKLIKFNVIAKPGYYAPAANGFR